MTDDTFPKMKVALINDSHNRDFFNNIEQLKDFVEGYKKSGGEGLVCFYIEKSGKHKNINHLYCWKDGIGVNILGALELIKVNIIEKISKE